MDFFFPLYFPMKRYIITDGDSSSSFYSTVLHLVVLWMVETRLSSRSSLQIENAPAMNFFHVFRRAENQLDRKILCCKLGTREARILLVARRDGKNRPFADFRKI